VSRWDRHQRRGRRWPPLQQARRQGSPPTKVSHGARPVVARSSSLPSHPVWRSPCYDVASLVTREDGRQQRAAVERKQQQVLLEGASHPSLDAPPPWRPEAQAVEVRVAAKAASRELEWYRGWPSSGPAEDDLLLRTRTCSREGHIDWCHWAKGLRLQQKQEHLPCCTALPGVEEGVDDSDEHFASPAKDDPLGDSPLPAEPIERPSPAPQPSPLPPPPTAPREPVEEQFGGWVPLWPPSAPSSAASPRQPPVPSPSEPVQHQLPEPAVVSSEPVQRPMPPPPVPPFPTTEPVQYQPGAPVQQESLQQARQQQQHPPFMLGSRGIVTPADCGVQEPVTSQPYGAVPHQRFFGLFGPPPTEDAGLPGLLQWQLQMQHLDGPARQTVTMLDAQFENLMMMASLLRTEDPH